MALKTRVWKSPEQQWKDTLEKIQGFKKTGEPNRSTARLQDWFEYLTDYLTSPTNARRHQILGKEYTARLYNTAWAIDQELKRRGA